MPPLLVRFSRWRGILLVLLMLPFVLGGLLLIGDADAETSLAGWASTVFFGALALFMLYMLLRRKPLITLNDEGIEDTRLKMGVIPWAEIESAKEVPFLWQKNVQLKVRHPEQYRQRQPGLLRAVGSANAALDWSPFTLVTTSTTHSAAQVVDYIYQQLLRQQLGQPAPPVANAHGEGSY